MLRLFISEAEAEARSKNNCYSDRKGERIMYKIIGEYKDNEPEEIDTADDYRDALYLKGEYQMAFGPEWVIYIE
jgi:hypothetical protein